MAAENYVQIQIKASDTAKPDLTALKAQLDELGAKVENAKVNVDDTDGTAKLLAINAKLTALDAKVAKPNVSVAGAAKAEADIAAIEASLARLGNDSATADAKVNTLRSRLMSFGGAVGSITGVGDAMTLASSDASMFQRGMAGASLATGLLEPAMAGVVVGVGGLASGLAAAGVGLGVFGVVAKANFTAAATAAKQVQTATDTYNASLKAGVSPAKAYQAEQKAIGVAYAELSPAQIKLSKEIGDVSNAWQAFVQKNTAGVSKILTQGFGLLPKIFQDMQKFMAPVEKALSDIIDKLGKGLDSSGFKNFIDMMAKNTGPAIEKIATAIGHVVVGIGGILKAFMPVSQGLLSGLDQITKKFAEWGSSLSGHTGFQSLMSTFKTETPLVIPILKNLAEIIKNIASAMTGLATGSNSKALLQILVPLSGTIATLTKNTDLLRVALYTLAAVDVGKKISGMCTGIQHGLQTLNGGVNIIGKFGKAAEDASVGAKLAAAATRLWSVAQVVLDAAFSPIGLVVIGIAALVAGIIYAYTHFQTFRTIVNDVGNFLKTVFIDALHAVETAVTAVGTFVVASWNTLKSAATTAWNAIKTVITTVWDALKTAATTAWNAISTVITTVWNALKTAATTAWNAISTAVTTVWNTLKSTATTVFDALKSFFQITWDAIKTIFTSAWTLIKSVVNTGVSDVKAILNWFAGLPGLFKGWWDQVVAAAKADINLLISDVKAIPGLILSALGNLGNLLFDVGKAIMQGLLNGIKQAWNDVAGFLSSLASKIKSLKGPKAKDLTLLTEEGQAIMQGLSTGIRSGVPGLESTLQNVTHIIQGGVHGGAAGPGGAGTASKMQVELQLTGSGDQFLVWLRNAIRTKGGNVQTVLGYGQ